MISEECAKLIRPVRQGHEHVWNEAGFLLDLEHLVADVGGQVLEFRNGIFADGVGHFALLSRENVKV